MGKLCSGFIMIAVYMKLSFLISLSLIVLVISTSFLTGTISGEPCAFCSSESILVTLFPSPIIVFYYHPLV